MKIEYFLIFCFVLSIASCSILFVYSASKKPYAPCNGCQSGPIFLRNNITFFNNTFDHLYVYTDGYISIGEKCHFLYCNKAIAAFYLAKPMTGTVIYEEILRSSLLANYKYYIHKYSKDSYFIPTSAFQVTWLNVQDVSDISTRTNSFQLIIVSSVKSCYVIYNYGIINWPDSYVFFGYKYNKNILEFNYTTSEMRSMSNIKERGVYVVKIGDKPIQKEKSISIIIKANKNIIFFLVYFYLYVIC